MAKKYLSGEELLHQIKRQPELPQRGGLKEYEPDGSWLQSKRLIAFNQERRDVLSEERVQKISSLSVGEWDVEQGKVLVKKSGKFWKNMGHVEDGKQWLYPEEALFLVDEGVMEVHRGELPLSVEESYSVLLRSDVAVEHYQAFAHLCRLGYIVRRHIKDFRITRYEKLIGLDKHVSAESKSAKRRKRQSCHEDNSSIDVANKKSKSDDIVYTDVLQSETGDERNDSDEAHPVRVEFPSDENLKMIVDAVELPENDVHQGKHQSPLNPATKEGLCFDTQNAITAGNKSFSTTMNSGWISHDATSISSEKERNLDAAMDNSESKCKIGHTGVDRSCKSMSADGFGVPRYSTWDFSSIKLPNMAEETSTEMVLESPPDHLLPPGVKLSRSSYMIDIKHYKRPSKIKVTTNPGSVLQVTTVQPNAKNWAEYKRLLGVESEAQSLASSPAGILWAGDVTPLIKPWQATSTCAVLSRLKVVENFDPFDLKERVEWGGCSGREQPQIIYDVFLPDAKFRKSDPGVPAVCLCISRQQTRMPSFASICQTMQQCPSGTTLMWAVVDCGDIAFYSFNGVDLPTELSFP